MNKRALVVVDIQNDYFPGGRWPLVGMQDAAANAARLIDGARQAGDAVVFVRHEFPTADAPFFAPGSAGAAIHPTIEGRAGEPVVLKHGINAFHDTDLRSVLDRDGIKEVVLCGAMSHMCIDAAARAATDLGYKTTVIHDACASHDLEFNGLTTPAAQVHASFMSALAFGYATVSATDAHLATSADEPA